MPSTPVIAVKFHRRDRPILLNREIASDAPGFVLRDMRGHEHHFGAPEWTSEAIIFSYVSSYTPDDGPQHEYHLRDALTEGFEVAEPKLGPNLTPLTRAAVDHVIEECARKGFAFPYEKEIGVQALLALKEANEPFPPDELWVYGATHGFNLDQAEAFRDLAQRVIKGRSFRPAIRLPPGHGDRLREFWRKDMSE